MLNIHTVRKNLQRFDIDLKYGWDCCTWTMKPRRQMRRIPVFLRD